MKVKINSLQNPNKNKSLELKATSTGYHPTIALQQSCKWCLLCSAIVSAIYVSNHCPRQLIVALLLLTISFFQINNIAKYMQELPQCHSYFAMTMLPLPCWLAQISPGWLIVVFQSIIPLTITGWMARIAAMHAAIVPWWWCCHHCANTMLTCLWWLVGTITACWLLFFNIFKYLDAIAGSMARSTAMPMPLYNNTVAILPCCAVFGAVSTWLICFVFHIHKSWVPSCTAGCCNVAATDAASFAVAYCCMATLVATATDSWCAFHQAMTRHMCTAWCQGHWSCHLVLLS